MATAGEGIISMSYRPLATMDELHVLLLVAISAQFKDVSMLEQIFSLPGNVVLKELVILEAYGLAQKVGGRWTATIRAQRIGTIWSIFQNPHGSEVQTNGRRWLLGPGEFAIDEMIRDNDEIGVLARGFGVGESRSALKCLDERRSVFKRFAAFVSEWHSRSQEFVERGVFAEALMLENLALAESDEGLMRLEELFATHIGEVVDRLTNSQIAGVKAESDGRADNTAVSIRKNGQDLMKKFENEKRTQRRQNQHLAKVKMTCESFLAGQWVLANAGALADAFKTEPAAFIFRSTVPIMAPEEPPVVTPQKIPDLSSTNRKSERQGALRSLWRWLFS